MAASNKKREAKSRNTPSRGIRTGADLDIVYKDIYSHTPSWNFHLCDKEGSWALTEDRLKEVFLKKILPFLTELESMTWGTLLAGAKKEHHNIPVENLNSCAQKRLDELHQAPDNIVSLRLGGKVRIYGIMEGPTLCILWYDDNHGDNDTCVCRSRINTRNSFKY